MRYKTLFRMALKFAGILLVVEAIATSVYIFPQLATWYVAGVTSTGGLWDFTFGQLLLSLVKGFAGLYFFFGGKWIVNLAIPSNRPYCPECAYDLSGAASERCPECGTAFRPADVAPPSPFSEP